MINNIKNVCVFASSSNDLEEEFYKVAQAMGILLGKNSYNIVYGGSRRGLMYACSSAVKENGGKVFGVMPEIFADKNLFNKDDCDEFFVTSGMRERKAKLDSLSDAVIALPGGFGTLEELSEMLVQKQLGYNNKPIVILNTLNFYDKMIQFFDDIISKNFANEYSKELYYVASTPVEAVEYIKNYSFENFEKMFVKY